MDREVLQSALERWDAARAELAAFAYEMLTTSERLALVEHLERAQRQDVALAHTVLASFAADADPLTFGEKTLRKVIATRLRIEPKAAGARLKDAQQLGPRKSFTGEPLPPVLPATAAALARGDIGAAHVAEIQKFFKALPGWVDAATRAEAEDTLARVAVGLDPEQLRVAAHALRDLFDPDGAEPNDDLQQRLRSFRIGKQQRDGMTPISGYVDPETACYLHTLNAKHGAPGTNLPDDLAGMPDTRTTGQRCHDAIRTGLRQLVGSGALGQVNGIPATIVATTTVDQLERAAGYADTGGGTRLPIRDLIRLAGQSRHYLAVFDDHHQEVLHFGRARRCASTAQRLALFARDKGCTRPGCTTALYSCEAHHEHDFSDGGRTDIDTMALACKPDNLTVEETGWTTRRRNGRTEWLPPPRLDTGQTRVNNYHHPERYLQEAEGDDDDEPE
ncbi:HNH endonuclease [Mycolicibacterium sp. S2-37]|uniref:HNH endonuclease signature motif containing protein n=1 Tax=Mycolicibacterium sp. S2-37 TaxID=2810297 RepID=UPI001A950B09|nr:HNH endonuclease signature motif containing protein [Mycolicibacterium sp. S2-37]MBO0677049.1 HNH endonuclease [Mycolicibacterium sp. S2-37]